MLPENQRAIEIDLPSGMSSARTLYHRVYDAVCGKHPHIRPWHFQWLAIRDVYKDLRRILPDVRGRVLDVGCGDKPYGVWLDKQVEHVGIDAVPGPEVDIVVEPGTRWPVESSGFDAVFCTQTLEHVADLEQTLSEIDRVLVPGGLLIVTVPFIYNFHMQPGVSDYRRLSHEGLKQLFDEYEIVEVKPQGGIGSTLGLLFLNWVYIASSRRAITQLAFGLLMPLWIPISIVVNLVGWFLDLIDSTEAFYSNVILIAGKPMPAE